MKYIFIYFSVILLHLLSKTRFTSIFHEFSSSGKEIESIRCFWNVKLKFKRNDAPELVIFQLQPLNNCELLLYEY